MKLIGVELQTPTIHDLIVAMVTTLVMSVVIYVLYMSGMLPGSNAVTAILGILGGSLAAAYGASIQNHGWRGVVISVFFGITVMLIGNMLHSIAIAAY